MSEDNGVTEVSEEEEVVRMNKNGSIRMIFGGRSYMLRPPKLGVFRDLRQILRDSQERVSIVRIERAEAGERLRMEDVDQTDDMMKFIQTSFGELSDRDLPPVEEWPPWLIGTTIAGEMIKHWQNVPLVSSSD